MTLLAALRRSVEAVRIPGLAARFRDVLSRFAEEEAERFLESARAAYRTAGAAGVQALDRVIRNGAKSVGCELDPLELAVLRRVLLRVLDGR